MEKRYQPRYKAFQIRKIYFLVVIVVLWFCSYTYGRNSESYTTNASLQIAKWNIKVNDTVIDENTSNINVTMQDIHEENGITTGHFEVTIDPKGTEVSIEYTLKFDVPEGVTITKYTLNDGAEQTDITGNAINGRILLENNSVLGSSAKHNYDVFWKYEGTQLNDTIDVMVDIKQLI